MSGGSDHIFLRGLDDWLETISGNGGAWTTALRRRAQERLALRGLPGPREEDWRFTPVKILSRHERAVLDGPGPVEASDLEAFAIPDLGAIRVVLVDGFLVPALSDLDALPEGLEILDYHEALATHRELVETGLDRDGGEEGTAFEALNAAWCRGGVVIRARANAVTDKPVHLLHLSTRQSTPAITHPRVVVHAERSAQFSLVEDHVALEGSREFVNLSVEISLAENARLEHVRLVRTGAEHVHLASTRSFQERDSRLHSVAVTLDGELVRHEIRAHLRGSNAEVTLNGLVLLDDAQAVDNHSWIHHDVTHTRSVQEYRNVLDGRSRAVFAGRVVVAEGASSTDAQQNNANLLLSDDAQINTLPQLEIYNDDVKASHGATLGQLDRDGLFYLRSRGIDEATARGLLTFAFANSVVETIPFAPVRALLRRQVFEHLPQAHLSEELV